MSVDMFKMLKTFQYQTESLHFSVSFVYELRNTCLNFYYYLSHLIISFRYCKNIKKKVILY